MSISTEGILVFFARMLKKNEMIMMEEIPIMSKYVSTLFLVFRE
jgi:hypothetical protein